jgi:hypothetical protein
LRCYRMQATIYHTNCLLFQKFYTFLGEPCSNCNQGVQVLAGIFDDSDIDEIKKSYETENIFDQN